MTANFKLKIRVQDVLSSTCSDANLTLLGQELIVNKSSLDTPLQIEIEDVILITRKKRLIWFKWLTMLIIQK